MTFRRETTILARGLGGVTFYLFAHYSLLHSLCYTLIRHSPVEEEFYTYPKSSRGGRVPDVVISLWNVGD